jgi:ribonuclease HI
MPRAPSPPAPIRIWSDGSCSPNPGPGGWGAIIDRDGEREEIFGGDTSTTNNLMEMQGAIEALMRTPPGARVVVTTDSQYLQLGITQWIRAWKRKQWRKSDGKPVLNQAQWQALDALVGERHVAWEWVRGHAGHAENERCDELARMGRQALQ